MEIYKNLQNKDAKLKAFIKKQVAEQVSMVGVHKRKGGLNIEILETKPIEKEGGIEILARVFKNNKQLGFGKDGTVDIERFRIFNPPILVPDDNGDIVQEWDEEQPDGTKVQKQRRLREDAQEALLQVIEHNLSVMKNVHPNSKRIVKGKRGNTTSTFYPSVDGYVGVFNQGSDWDIEHDRTIGNQYETNSTVLFIGQLKTTLFGGPNISIYRWFLVFDTSTIPDTDNIDTATLSLYLLAKNTGTMTGESVLVQSTPASNTSLTYDDYDQCGAVDNPTEGASRFDGFTDWTVSSYNDIVLNATGRSWISKTGYTRLGIRHVADATDTYPGSGQVANEAVCYSADQSGTTQDPKLVVEHSSSSSPSVQARRGILLSM